MKTAHTIQAKKNEAGMHDVLMNGCSYRIHRNKTEAEAAKLCVEIKASFKALGERAYILTTA